MPVNPFRRRSKLADAAKLAAADAALTYAKDRITPGSRKRGRGKAILLGGAVVAVGVAAMANRNKVAGLIGARSSVPEPPPPPAPPTPTNYDAPGPPANTATPVPAPEPVTPEPIDERAEEEAAAAEAAAIGGDVSGYASSDPSLTAEEAERPLVEAGEGEAEGQEQTEAQLEENLAPPEGGGETPELEEHPASGPVSPTDSGVSRFFEGLEQRPAAPSGPEAEGTPRAEAAPETPSTPETPAAGDPAERDETARQERDDRPEEGGGWQTWSGISSRP